MRLPTIGMVVATTVIFGIGPASADTAGHVTDVTVDKAGHLSLTLAAPGLDPSQVRLFVDGHRVPATAAATTTRQAAGKPVTVMLVIDISGSMSGQGIVAARNAARQFLVAVPTDVKVGLETFSDIPRVLVAPATSRKRLLAALPGLQPGGETALYDALVTASGAVGRSGQRRLVVISDGADTVSRTALPTAIGELTREHVAVEVVGLRTAETDNSVLRRVAGDTGGRFVLAGNGAALAAALRSSARSYATAISVHATVPTSLWGERRHLTVAVDSSAGTVMGNTTATIGSIAQSIPTATRHGASNRLLWEGLLGIAAALMLGSAALLGGDVGERRRARRLVNRYSMTPETETGNGASSIRRRALELTDRVAQRRGLSDRLNTRLTRAGLSLTPSEWLLLQAGIAFLTVLIFLVFGMTPVVAVIAGIVVGPLLGHFFLSVRFARRKAAFVAALPDTLQLVAGSLSAGYSLAQSLDGVVNQGEQPISGEFGRALAESRLGVPIERTLESVAERMDSEDFRWVVLAIQIQHKVGGNLAEVLLTVAQTMRERVQLHRHVRALSAEGRLSAYILGGLPVLFTLYLAAARGAYLRPLYTTKMGLAMIVMAVVMFSIGALVMKKLVKVEV